MSELGYPDLKITLTDEAFIRERQYQNLLLRHERLRIIANDIIWALAEYDRGGLKTRLTTLLNKCELLKKVLDEDAKELG